MAGGGDERQRLERQLETAQRITHIGSWEWEVATGALRWSDELYRIYGLEPGSAAVSFEWFLTRVHPEDRDRVQGEITGAIGRGGRFAHQERIVRPDGSVRELDTVGEVVADDAGNPVLVTGTCRDITEERRREETIQLYADVVGRIQIGMSVWRLDDPRDPGALRLLGFNDAAASQLQLAGQTGKTLAAIAPELMGTELPALLAAAGAGAGAPVSELPAFRLLDAPGAPTFAVKAFALPDRSVGLALEDVSERARDQRLFKCERRALEMLAAGTPLRDILALIVEMIEAEAEGCIASVLLLDPTGTRLAHGAGPSLPEEYNRAIDGAAIGPAAGSCGTASYRRQPVFVQDVATDPLWEGYRHLVLPHGLRACWSSPILATDGRVLGTFAIYHREPCLPGPLELALIERARHVAGIAIERRQLDDAQRALAARIEAIREDERTGIAREIHDELGQALTALKLDVAWLARRLGTDDAIGEKLAEMASNADEVLHVVRRISAELRPGILDDLGLLAAIEWQAEEFAARGGTACTVRSEVGDLRLERNLATAVFRIFQEALTNVARHASATEVTVELSLERGHLRLQVSDDGVGLPEAATRPRSLGLLGMRERARRLGGDCVIRRREPRGTVVSLVLPLRFPVDTADTDVELRPPQ